MSTKSSDCTTRSSSCIVCGLLLASITMNAFFLAGCVYSPHAGTLKTLAGEDSGGGWVNPFAASSDAERLKSIVEKRLSENGGKIKTAYSEGCKEGEIKGRETERVECIKKLSRIAEMEVDVRGEDALDKAIAAVMQRIDTLEKNRGDDAARPRRLMRDIASKLGVVVNDKMGVNDLHDRIVGAIEIEANVPHLMSEEDFKAALDEITWKKEFGDYHNFIKRLNGKRIIIIPASR